MYAHARSPVRIGIAGGGTDLPAWTKSGVGRCLSLAVNMYTHAVAIARRDGQVVAAYRQRDTSNSATEIANGLIRESALLHGWESGFEVHTISELSSRGSGLGVSSSIAVSLAACFQRLAAVRAGEDREPRWSDGGEDSFRATTARDAWTVEIDHLRRPIGRQDHMAAAYGGLRLYRFEGEGASIERSFSSREALWVSERLALLALPNGHDASAILSKVSRTDMLAAAAEAVPIAVEAIEKCDVWLLGEALTHGQRSKSAIPGATPPQLAAIVETVSRAPGICGCKVAGAGGGGHVVVAFEHRREVDNIAEMLNLTPVYFGPDLSGVRSEAWV